MYQEREDLDIIFRRTLPETVLENLRLYGNLSVKYPLKAGAKEYSLKTYEHFSTLNLTVYSSDEIEMRHRALKGMIADEGGSIFTLLYRYANSVLSERDATPICQIEQILNWNSITLRLGQDLFTTSWLAWKDVNNGRFNADKRKFAWPAVLKTDDKRLEMMFERGLAENHFHLHGSTQSFSLSWACLMNHPDCIKQFCSEDSRFEENLNPAVSKGILDKQMKWEIRILYAAMIRILFFKRILGILDSQQVWDEFEKFDWVPLVSTVSRHSEVLRTAYGVKFEQIDKKKKCLDYAICGQLLDVEMEKCSRLLAGERGFLYHCFKMQFLNELSERESYLLYIYLLIKSNFRSELIQCNDRYGFKNFLNYQDRKNQFFEYIDEYRTEAQRLSVGEAMGNNHVVSLEARVMPKNFPTELEYEIKDLCKRMGMCPLVKIQNIHFVTHFPKTQFSVDEFKNKKLRLIPRNEPVRNNCKVKSKALHKYFRTHNRAMPYVSGIDACASEIGCRPETFATEFRYLKDSLNAREKVPWYVEEKVHLTKIGHTYHVGEDYLDILDGLRAVDEAILFLEMGKGDRLGHAIALGIEPEYYYNLKNRTIYLPKQDRLDNLVWLLHKTLECNIVMETNHRLRMEEEARQLLDELYVSDTDVKLISESNNILERYYESWQLRGDHPELYQSGEFKDKKGFGGSCYESYMKRDESLEIYRKNKIVATLCYLYHFDADVKLKGMKPVSYEIPDWYIQIIRELQRALRIEVAKKNIAIECNPSSNVLISTFRRYDKHPILAFNNYHLEDGRDNPHIDVSINTDDIGVFDTSLENEYALLFCALHMEREQRGIYDDNGIYEYLEHLRENGLRVSFLESRDSERL